MNRILDPLDLENTNKKFYLELVGRYSYNNARDKVTDINQKIIRGLKFAHKVVKLNADGPGDYWQIWMADTPIRAVVVFGDKKPWEPGVIMLDDGRGDYCPTIRSLKRSYRRVCLASAYYSTWKEQLYANIDLEDR